MKKIEIYKEAYRLLDLITPFQTDCGRLCNQACCNAEDEETGMYLFPYEEEMFHDCPVWLRMEETDFTYKKGENAWIALCEPPCARSLRPLSCRIFPLLPYLDQMGDLKIIMDPRGRGICPLIHHSKLQALDPAFVRRVRLVFSVLMRFEPIYEFLFALSRQVDEIHAFNKKLRGK